MNNDWKKFRILGASNMSKEKAKEIAIKWKDENPTITAELFRQCIYMLNDICYEQGTGVDETDIEYVIKIKNLP